MASKRKTVRGFGDPEEPQRESGPPPPPSPLAETSRVIRDKPTSPLEFEIDHVHETGTAVLTGPWRAVEIWTQNRVYGLDAALICRSVADRASGSASVDHPTIGARLLGGQVRDKAGRITQVSHPLPQRGAAAVFASGDKCLRVSETSAVTRVIYHQRVVDVAAGSPSPRWEDITGDDDSD